MPGPNAGYDKGFQPTAAVAQYRVVRQTANQQCALPSAATQVPLGVTQEECTADNVTDGRVINVRMDGSSFLECAEAISIGARVGFDTNGKGVVIAATEQPLGIARTAAAADGDLIVVQINITGLAAA
jgi:Uncharacterized conserved protein (DUF2190)